MQTPPVPYLLLWIVLVIMFFHVFAQVIKCCKWVFKLWKEVRSNPLPTAAPTQFVDDSTIIKCGVCKSVIMSKPINRICYGTKGDRIIYQCHQCGTNVALDTKN